MPIFRRRRGHPLLSVLGFVFDALFCFDDAKTKGYFVDDAKTKYYSHKD
jgi:hypothetical protein